MISDTNMVANRLQKDPTAGEITVDKFVQKIMEQCTAVLREHEKLGFEKYHAHGMYRTLEMEMVDVKIMALSKLQEWLQNTSNSFIKFRFNAALRTVHRRHIAFQERILEEIQEVDTRKEHKKLCQLRGIIVDDVEELNDLKETKLMAAAAEGRSMLELKLLVRAGASVSKTRPDGVTAIWLAAQFGHGLCIRTLAELKADVNQAANDGATPAYIASQSGFQGCIELLAALGADLKQTDTKKTTALHQVSTPEGICLCAKGILLLIEGRAFCRLL